MEKFTASNGWELREGQIYFSGGSKAVGRDGTDALREVFLAERDAEFGRWRWPEHPEYVAYPHRCGGVRVLNETTLGIGHFASSEHTAGSGELAAAARAYFAAHPVRKPWEDAKPGEVWALTTRNVGDEVAARVALVNDVVSFDYISGVMRFPVSDDRVTSARRIWPEVSE